MSEQPEQKETAEQNTDEQTAGENNAPSSSENRPPADTRPQDEQTGEGTGARAGEYN